MRMRLPRRVILQQSRARKQSRKLPVELGIALARRRRIGDHNRLTAAKRRELEPRRRPQSTLDLVAHDGFADLVRNGKTHPHGSSGRIDKNNVLLGQAFAVSVNVRKRAVLIEPVRFVEQLLSERRGRKPSSALVATALKDASAALRLHSLTKAVHLALSALFGLVSSLHNVTPNLCGFSPQ